MQEAHFYARDMKAGTHDYKQLPETNSKIFLVIDEIIPLLNGEGADAAIRVEILLLPGSIARLGRTVGFTL